VGWGGRNLFSRAPVGSFEEFCGAMSTCTRHLMSMVPSLGEGIASSVPVKSFECSRSHVNHSCRIKASELVSVAMDFASPSKCLLFKQPASNEEAYL
jgi:hypothetical protein